MTEETDAGRAVRALSARVRERFDEAGLTQADVEAAIDWARSQ